MDFRRSRSYSISEGIQIVSKQNLMKLICPRCQTHNQSDAYFCQKCGTGFNVQSIRPTRQNSISTPVIIITAVIAICGFGGVFSLLSGNKTEIAANTGTATAKSFISTVPPTITSPHLQILKHYPTKRVRENSLPKARS